MVDPVVNKGKVTVSTGYNNTATSIVLATGQGAELPDPVVDGEYNLPWWDSTNYNDPADDPNYEIVRVTGPAGTGDTKTIVRAQEGTAATNKNNADATYKMHLGVTAKTITDLRDHSEFTSLDINQTNDEVAVDINHDATTADKFPLQINSLTSGPRFEQDATLGGASNYFEPSYPSLELLRISGSRGSTLKIGNTTGGSYIYGDGNGISFYNSNGVTRILELNNVDNILNVKIGFAGAPSSDTNITAAGGITVTNLIMRVQGNGGAIDITADPQIAAGIDGQMVTLFGASDANTLTLDNGTGLALSAQMVLSKLDNITLVYDSGENVWIETNRTTVT